MNMKMILTILDGIEEIAPLLDELPETEYSLYYAEEKQITGTIKRVIEHILKDDDTIFIILLPKKSYFKEEESKNMANMIVESGIKAEPVFLVADKAFSWQEISYIVHHNHMFFQIPENKDEIKT